MGDDMPANTSAAGAVGGDAGDAGAAPPASAWVSSSFMRSSASAPSGESTEIGACMQREKNSRVCEGHELPVRRLHWKMLRYPHRT